MCGSDRSSEKLMFEPGRVARSVKLMEVKHAVLTSVDRDDLKDGGASIWVMTVRLLETIANHHGNLNSRFCW